MPNGNGNGNGHEPGAFERHAYDDDWYDLGDRTYEDMLEMLIEFEWPVTTEAANNLYDGWFNSDVTPDERHNSRELFFEELQMDPDDFPWDDWREWYDAA